MNSIATPKKKRRWVLPVACTGALLAGVGIGATAQPEPEVITETVVETETVTEEVEVIVTEEVEVEVEVTPASCISALDAADNSIDLLMELNDHTIEGAEAAARFDVAGIDAATAKITAMTPDMEAAGFDWGFWSESCREAAK